MEDRRFSRSDLYLYTALTVLRRVHRDQGRGVSVTGSGSTAALISCAVSENSAGVQQSGLEGRGCTAVDFDSVSQCWAVGPDLIERIIFSGGDLYNNLSNDAECRLTMACLQQVACTSGPPPAPPHVAASLSSAV